MQIFESIVVYIQPIPSPTDGVHLHILHRNFSAVLVHSRKRVIVIDQHPILIARKSGDVDIHVQVPVVISHGCRHAIDGHVQPNVISAFNEWRYRPFGLLFKKVVGVNNPIPYDMEVEQLVSIEVHPLPLKRLNSSDSEHTR